MRLDVNESLGCLEYDILTSLVLVYIMYRWPRILLFIKPCGIFLVCVMGPLMDPAKEVLVLAHLAGSRHGRYLLGRDSIGSP